MKLGISDALGTHSPEEWAQTLKEHDCRAASFPIDYTHDLKEIDAYAEAARENNILIAEVGAWSNPLSFDRETQLKALEKCIEQLKLADYLGANCACNITGSAGEIWDYYYPENMSEKFYDRMVMIHQQILDAAKPVHTCYAVEPMPWMVPTGPDSYLKFIQDVGPEHMKVHLDMVNWMNGFDRLHGQRAFMDEVFRKLHGLIVSCHLKDCRLNTTLTFMVQETLIGTGMFDFPYYIQKINEEDEDLPVLIEHLNTNEDYFNSLRTVREALKKI